MQEPKTSKRQLNKEMAVVILAISLTAVFIGAISTGTVKWDKSFSESVLVKIENFDNQMGVVSTVEKTADSNAVVASSSDVLLLELPVSYSTTLADQIENALAGTVGEVNVLKISPLFEHHLFIMFLIAVDVGLIALGIVLLLMFRRKRTAWACPLIIGLTMGETFGAFILLGFPLGIGALVGVTITFLTLLNFSSIMLTGQLRTDEEISKMRKHLKELFLSALGVLMLILVVFMIPTQESILFNAALTVLFGGVFGYLNLGWVMVYLLREKVHPAVVKYHVSL